MARPTRGMRPGSPTLDNRSEVEKTNDVDNGLYPSVADLSGDKPGSIKTIKELAEDNKLRNKLTPNPDSKPTNLNDVDYKAIKQFEPQTPFSMKPKPKVESEDELAPPTTRRNP